MAPNAYPAISGPYNRHAKEVEKFVPEFRIMFQRFRKEGYVLIVSLLSVLPEKRCVSHIDISRLFGLSEERNRNMDGN